MRDATRKKLFSFNNIGSSILFTGTLCLFMGSSSDSLALWVGSVFVVAGTIVMGIGDRKKEQGAERSLTFANLGANFLAFGIAGLIFTLISRQQPPWIGVTVAALGTLLIITAIIQAKTANKK